MQDRHDLSAAQRRQRDRRLWRTGLLVSLVLHLVVFIGWRHRPLPLSPFAAAGPRAGDARAAQGGMEVMALRTPPTVPLIPPPIPLPTLTDIEPIELDPQPTLDVGAMLSEAPGIGEPGPGLEEGTGKGDGGTAEEGLFRLVPPTPRGMIIPPANKNLKGRQVQVWVFVDERGRVVADSTHLRPPTSDRDFNRRLIREASEWVFEPAKKGGQPVATWFPYTISM